MSPCARAATTGLEAMSLLVAKGSGTDSAAHWTALVEVRSAALSSPAPSTSSTQAAASHGRMSDGPAPSTSSSQAAAGHGWMCDGLSRDAAEPRGGRYVLALSVGLYRPAAILSPAHNSNCRQAGEVSAVWGGG